MITKKFNVDYFTDVMTYPSLACTLNPEEVFPVDHRDETGTFTRTHADGWTITGTIVEDYFYWVNSFEAVHPCYGRVWGNFEEEVYCDSEEGFLDFMTRHKPELWDYHDI